jgi:hypothetical protein
MASIANSSLAHNLYQQVMKQQLCQYKGHATANARRGGDHWTMQRCAMTRLRPNKARGWSLTQNVTVP